jgi:hypothetical protein
MQMKGQLTISEITCYNYKIINKRGDTLKMQEMNHRITVYDNVLPEELFGKVTEFLDKEGESLSLQKTSFWTDFSLKNCPIEEMAAYLKPFITEERKNNTIVGAEWWVKYKDKSEVGHPLHKDIDDKLYLKNKKVKRPDIGSVFYLNYSNGLEGNLVLYTSPYSNTPIYVPPEPNRLVVFDAGNLPHGVTNKDGEIIDRSSPQEKATILTNDFRICVPINWWSNEISEAQGYKEYFKETILK